MKEFINLVKQNRFLYDPSHEKYKDIKCREDAWLQLVQLDSNGKYTIIKMYNVYCSSDGLIIVKMYELSVEEFKLRWNNLQNFYREAKK